jgi:hypothetical protein
MKSEERERLDAKHQPAQTTHTSQGCPSNLREPSRPLDFFFFCSRRQEPFSTTID